MKRKLFVAFLSFMFIFSLYTSNIPKVEAATIQIDHNYSGYVSGNSSADTVCHETGDQKYDTSDPRVILPRQNSGSCAFAYITFDIENIPYGANIQEIILHLWVDYVDDVENVTIVSLFGTTPQSLSADQIYDEIRLAETEYATDLEDFQTTGLKAIELNDNALLEMGFAQSTGNFSIGFRMTNQTRPVGSGSLWFEIYHSGSPVRTIFYLSVTYTTSMTEDLTLNVSPSYIYRSQTNVEFFGFYKSSGVCTWMTQNVTVAIENNKTGTWQTAIGALTDQNCMYSMFRYSHEFIFDDENGTYHFRTVNLAGSAYSDIVTVTVNITEPAPTDISVSINVVPTYVNQKNSDVNIYGFVLFGGLVLEDSYNRYVCLESNSTVFGGGWNSLLCKRSDANNALYNFAVWTGSNQIDNQNGTYHFRVRDQWSYTYSENVSFIIGVPTSVTPEIPDIFTIADFITGLGVALGIGEMGGGFVMIMIIVGFFIALMGKFRFPPEAILLISTLVGLCAVAMMTLFIEGMLWVLITFIFVIVAIFAAHLRGTLSGGD